MKNKLSKITVRRKIEKTVTYKKMIDTDVEITPIDITDEEIYTLSEENARAIASMFRKLYLEYKEISQEAVDKLRIAVDSSEPHTVASNTTIENNDSSDTAGNNDCDTDNTDNSDTLTHHDRKLGVKTGHTSKYRYVYFAKADKKYHIVHDGSFYTMEIEAAIASDKWLDEHNDDRPRNRDLFDEVKEYDKS